MLEPSGAGSAEPRAFLRVGGATVARHQLALALAMACERVICLARAISPELIALQHEAERAGVKFHVIAGITPLAGLITAHDELLVVGDGLLTIPGEATGLLEGGPAVLVQPVEAGVAAGFERIDINHATAGLMQIPGRLVERLSDLPSDCDVASALTRIALQAGIATREVPASVREGGHWKLVREEAEAHVVEAEWFNRHIGQTPASTPGYWLARFAARGFGPALLHAGSSGNAVILAVFALGLFALGAGWFAYTAIALSFCAACWIFRQAGALLLRVERDSLNLPAASPWRAETFAWLFDLALVAILVWTTPNQQWLTLPQRAFAPAMLLCLCRLLPLTSNRDWTAWLNDRFVLAIVLAVAAGTGLLHQTIYVLALGLGLFGILVPRITRA